MSPEIKEQSEIDYGAMVNDASKGLAGFATDSFVGKILTLVYTGCLSLLAIVTVFLSIKQYFDYKHKRERDADIRQDQEKKKQQDISDTIQRGLVPNRLSIMTDFEKEDILIYKNILEEIEKIPIEKRKYDNILTAKIKKEKWEEALLIAKNERLSVDDRSVLLAGICY